MALQNVEELVEKSRRIKYVVTFVLIYSNINL
jgi:hypothetical protein